MPKRIILHEEDEARIRALMVDSPSGRRVLDIALTLGLSESRVYAHLSAGRKVGLFIMCRTGGTMWYSCAHASVVRAKHAAALAAEIEQKRIYAKAWYEAKQAREDADDFDPLPVRRVVRRTWDRVLTAPGPASVFTLGDAVLRNC